MTRSNQYHTSQSHVTGNDVIVDSPELLAHVNAIRSLGKQTIANVVSMGEHLTARKGIVGHGGFGDFLKREFAWHENTALNYMRVFELSKSTTVSERYSQRVSGQRRRGVDNSGNGGERGANEHRSDRASGGRPVNPRGIPTRYRGVNFRSRLEAKYAALFDQLGWRWTYEPIDLGGWIPDFAIEGKPSPILVEVKPIFEFDAKLSNENAQAVGHYDQDLLANDELEYERVICGAVLPKDSFSSIALGWLWDNTQRQTGTMRMCLN